MKNKLNMSIPNELDKIVNPRLIRYSVFVLADKFFGLELFSVKEVISLPKISRVPNVPKHILGVFNLRGTIMTIVEINEMLGIASQEIYEENMIVIVESEKQSIGILVNRVLDLVSVDESEIQIPTREMSPKMVGFLSGFYDREGIGTIYLLNYKKLLDPQNFTFSDNF
jgi:purine-binding chemotaxis protein CheW